MILFYADTRHASATSDDPVTTGSVGIPVTVTLTPDYTGLNATLVFENGTTYADVPLLGQDVTVPSDVCLKTGKLRMGVYASDQSGEVVIPTIWADVSPVVVGVRPSGIDPAPPAPSWADLVMEAARKAREDAEVARADADSARADADSAREDAEAAKSDAERALAVSNDVEMLEDVSVSLTPFFARKPPYGGAHSDDYWKSYNTYYLADLDGGWAHWHEELAGDQDGRRWSHEFISVAKSGDLRPGGVYTFILEVRNFVCVAGDESEPPNIFFGYGSGGSGANTQVYDPKQVSYPISHDGKYVITLAGSLVQDKPNLIHIGASSIAGSVFDCDIRMSLYSGTHVGGYIANPTNAEDALSLTSKTADEAHAVNLTPMFSAYDDDSYWNSISAKYSDEPHPRNGWIGLHITDDDNDRRAIVAVLGKLDWIVSNAPYTLLIDVVGLDESSTEATLSVHTSRSQLYQRSTGYVDVTTTITDGSYRFFMSARDNPHTSFLICATSFSIVVPSGVEATFAVRASLYDGDYTGEYKPCLSWINGEVEGLSEAVNSLDETVGDVSEAIGGINENVATITEELSEVSGSIRHLGDNLTPFFSRQPTGESPDPYWYWHHSWQSAEYLGGGWMRAECDNDVMGSAAMYTYVPRRIEGLRAGARYTLLVEVRNLDHGAIEGGEHEPSDRNPFIKVGYNDYDYQLNVASYAKQEQPITGDGRYLYEVYAADNIASSSRDKLVKCNVFAPPYQHVSVEVRISLWEGDYDGPWKPCPWWLGDEVESISGNISDISEEISEIKEDISLIGGVKNLTPFFSHNNVGSGALIIDQYWESCDAWRPDDDVYEAGWWGVGWSDSGSEYREWVYACPRKQGFVEDGATYTLLVEVSGLENDGDVTPAIRVGSSSSQLVPTNPNDGDESVVEVEGDGQYRFTLTTRQAGDSDEAYRLVDLVFLVPSSQDGMMMVRASLYEGDYEGDYIPFWDHQFVDEQLQNACHAIGSLSSETSNVRSIASNALSLTAHNVVPMLSALGDDSRWYSTESLPYVTYLVDGWAHVGIGEDGVGAPDLRLIPATSDVINIEKRYTLLVEVRNVRYAGPGELKVKVPKKSSTPKQQLYYDDYESSTYKTFYKSDNYRKLLLPGLGANRFNDSQCDCLMVVEFTFAGDSRFEFDLRLSVYDDKSYQGDYVPCEWWLASEVERLSGEVATLGDTVGELSEVIEGIDVTVAAAVAEATASEDVSNNVVINPDLPVFAGGAQARRIGGVVFLSATIQLSERITISSNDTLVFTFTGKALPETFTYLATSIPGVQVVVGMGKMTIRATGADVSVGVSDDFIISGSYLAQ